MSRVGKKPVVLPSGVTATLSGRLLKVTGPKGELSLELHPLVSLSQTEKELTLLVPKQEDKKQKALWGLSRALVQNLVDGVTTGYTKELDVVGVGFKAEMKGAVLVLNLGFSHPIEFPLPAGVEGKVEKQPAKTTIQQYQTTVTLTGIDKQLVGQVAANIRALKKPEPYKGKGIKYSNETIIRKAGKVVKAVGGK
jgi:large subunit ribosomal protein L6